MERGALQREIVAQPGADISLEEKLAFLRNPSCYPQCVFKIETIETHMSSMLRICPHWLEGRMHGTHIVEGHGDLRPEHVCIRERIDYLGLAERHQACASAVSEPPS
jgi:aminoglycoside phosphotransferase family enzyme